MRLLIVILNKLVRIITRRNRLVSKIALGDHLVGWSSIRGSIFRRIGYVLRGTFVFLTRARARGVRGYFWDSGSFRRRPGCGRRFCDFRKTFIFCANLLPDAFFDRLLMECSIFCEKRDLGRLRSCSYSRKRRKAKVCRVIFPKLKGSDFELSQRFNANMSVYLYMSILGPLKGLPLNTFENYGMASWWPVNSG